jgi:hypothetical protein
MGQRIEAGRNPRLVGEYVPNKFGIPQRPVALSLGQTQTLVAGSQPALEGLRPGAGLGRCPPSPGPRKAFAQADARRAAPPRGDFESPSRFAMALSRDWAGLAPVVRQGPAGARYLREWFIPAPTGSSGRKCRPAGAARGKCPAPARLAPDCQSWVQGRPARPAGPPG